MRDCASIAAEGVTGKSNGRPHIRCETFNLAACTPGTRLKSWSCAHQNGPRHWQVLGYNHSINNQGSRVPASATALPSPCSYKSSRRLRDIAHVVVSMSGVRRLFLYSTYNFLTSLRWESIWAKGGLVTPPYWGIVCAA